VLGGLLRRQPALDPATIDEVYVGAANQAGDLRDTVITRQMELPDRWVLGDCGGMQQEFIDVFVRDGFVKVEQAVPAPTVEACTRLLWQQIDAEPDDRSTWKQPVYWVGGMAQEPFVEAANSPVLLDAFDALAGPGRWQPRDSIGVFPLRFPHAQEPDDAGWHVEGSYTPLGETQYFTNVHSRGRALLMLFLFTDVDEQNAPTRIRVGSHHDVPVVLSRYGDAGASGPVLSPEVAAASAHRPIAFATGRAGDVYLCHPFLVHAAQPHHGTRPRFMAQPPLYPTQEHMLAPFAGNDAPVGASIRRALNVA
jgi:hypothetical protein